MSVAILSPEQYEALTGYATRDMFIALRSGELFEAGHISTADELYAAGLSREDIELALGMGDLLTLDDSWWSGGFESDSTFTRTPGGEEIVVVEY